MTENLEILLCKDLKGFKALLTIQQFPFNKKCWVILKGLGIEDSQVVLIFYKENDNKQELFKVPLEKIRKLHIPLTGRFDLLE